MNHHMETMEVTTSDGRKLSVETFHGKAGASNATLVYPEVRFLSQKLKGNYSGVAQLLAKSSIPSVLPANVIPKKPYKNQQKAEDANFDRFVEYCKNKVLNPGQSFSVVAFFSGAITAARYADSYPDAIDHLILINPLVDDEQRRLLTNFSNRLTVVSPITSSEDSIDNNYAFSLIVDKDPVKTAFVGVGEIENFNPRQFAELGKYVLIPALQR